MYSIFFVYSSNDHHRNARHYQQGQLHGHQPAARIAIVRVARVRTDGRVLQHIATILVALRGARALRVRIAGSHKTVGPAANHSGLLHAKEIVHAALQRTQEMLVAILDVRVAAVVRVIRGALEAADAERCVD